MTSSGPSGPPKESSSTASYMRSSCPTRFGRHLRGYSREDVAQRHSVTSGADGVEPAVDVENLAARRREPVREQAGAGAGGRLGVGEVPAQRRALRPRLLELLEAGDALRGHRAERAGGDEVDANPL